MLRLTYVLDLSDERICPVCCFDLDQRIATDGTMRFSLSDLRMKASRPREGGQGFFRISVSRAGRGVGMVNPDLVRKIAPFMIHEQIKFVNKPSPNCLGWTFGFLPLATCGGGVMQTILRILERVGG
jgi:hypothetical protein